MPGAETLDPGTAKVHNSHRALHGDSVAICLRPPAPTYRQLIMSHLSLTNEEPEGNSRQLKAIQMRAIIGHLLSSSIHEHMFSLRHRSEHRPASYPTRCRENDTENQTRYRHPC